MYVFILYILRKDNVYVSISLPFSALSCPVLYFMDSSSHFDCFFFSSLIPLCLNICVDIYIYYLRDIILHLSTVQLNLYLFPFALFGPCFSVDTSNNDPFFVFIYDDVGDILLWVEDFPCRNVVSPFIYQCGSTFAVMLMLFFSNSYHFILFAYFHVRIWY